MTQFNRLNAMGEEVGKPTDRPTSRIANGGTRQVSVLYGHEGGGKAYTYLAGPSVRAGDVVTPEVTHPKSGKTYNTLARVVSTRAATGSPAGDTAEYLSGQGIILKTIGSTDQKSLPGYYEGWAKDAKVAKEFETEARLGGASKAQLREVNSFTKSARQDAKQKYDSTQMKRLNAMGEVSK